MTEMQESVNRVFAEWENTFFSQGEREWIAMEHGQTVLAAVLAIYQRLMGLEAGPGGLDQALRRVREVVAQEYPWLSETAIGKLSHALTVKEK